MAKYQLISDYKHIETYKESFNELAQKVFGIDFSKWDENGCWNDNYICYSFIYREQVIANASINKMTVVCNGIEYKAIQVGTVMTHPEFRNQGLSKKLLNHIIEKHENEIDFIYLFANETVLNFYPKFGFEKVQESSFSLCIADLKKQTVPTKTIRQLDIENLSDLLLMKEFAKKRTSISTKLAVENNEQLLMFYFLQVFNDAIFYIEEEDVIVLFKKEDEQLHIYDLISRKEVELETIINYLISDEIKRIHFYFTPNDKIKNIDTKFITASNDTLFVRPLLKALPNHFLFPLTSHA
ncbi:GNAT family N-acetyltransferase [Niallia circulans]|uniref:GNAT family N-acetyltransferase n=1 Tax=Niallia circulans TaxID=1397 RepID=UPI002041E154|nr:GNAT family N-acetyltransferase [Niallia circulans]MCM2980876.1 GNAT family N-acetyltransferase [Niallia circulans]